MKISVSDSIDNFQTVDCSTVKELATLACQKNISTGIFKDGKRNIDSFLYAECIGLDIDNDNKAGTPQLTLAEAKQIFAGKKHLILTTRSHQKEKNGNVADRFRVILFLDTPITTAEDYYATWFKLKADYPAIDNQCKDPSRFWYRHGGIHSAGQGELIKPVKYVAPVKQAPVTQEVSAGAKGELSKATLKLLEFGVEPGNRNGAVYKAAREFNQNLYTHEEAAERIVNALERNNVFDNDFTEEEVRLTIASAFKREAKHEPRLEETKPRAFTYAAVGELLDKADEKVEWVVDGILGKGCIALIVGEPKLGKTTLVRQLEKCVLRGDKFLDRTVTKGTVLHFSFDEKPRTAMHHYRKLGLTKDDPMNLHFGPATTEESRKDFEEDLMRLKPTLVVIDTLFDKIQVESVNDYGSIKRALSWYSDVADRTGSLILFVHHTNKPSKERGSGGGHSILGSTAIFGSVDCALIFERDKDNRDMRTIQVSGRGVEGFDKKVLKFDRVKQIYTIDEVEF